MTVLVTRPAQAGQQLCQQLTQAGFDTLHHPLLAINAGRELPDLPSRMQQADMIIAVSQHAVHFAHQTLTEQHSPWSTNAIYFAIGQKTAHVFSKVTQQKVHYPAHSDSEHLLQCALLQQVSDQTILILRGNGGRELIHDTLTQRGGKVQYLEAYQRQPLAFDAQQSVKNWQQQNVDTVIVTSEEQLRLLFSPLAAAGQTWLQRQHVLVPSDRIRDVAHQLGCHQITTIGGASNDEIIKALQLT